MEMECDPVIVMEWLCTSVGVAADGIYENLHTSGIPTARGQLQ